MRRAPLRDLEARLERAQGGAIELSSPCAHYLREVVRLEVGDQVELFDGAGLLATARLIELAPRAMAKVERIWRAEELESVVPLTLCQAIPKGDRWGWILEKATELGAHAIRPIVSERTVVRIAPAKIERKIERWAQIVEGASRQCGRAIVPQVHAPRTLAEALAEARDEARAEELHLAAALHRRGAESISEVLAGQERRAVSVWVGPEGGFSAAELERFERFGARFVTLGEHVLRADTAALSALTLVQAARRRSSERPTA